jgi:hypothetical protein
MAGEREYEWVNAWASASGVAVAPTAPQADPPVRQSESQPAEPSVPRAEPPVERTASTVEARIARFVVTKLDGEREAARWPQAQAARPAIAAPLPDQLMRDMAEIARARDALEAGAAGRHMRAFMVVPARSADSAPLLVGGVLALVMLTVFGAAAAMSKFGR